MRKIIVGAQVSMDGVMQAPGGPTEDPTKGFKFGGWAIRYFDQEFVEALDHVFGKFDLLLGRKTYEIFAGYWPYSHGRIGKVFNDIKKYAVSRSGELDTTWAGSVLLRDVAEVKRLRREDGPNLLTQGSTELVHALLANDLVDAMSLFTVPDGLIVGHYEREGEIKIDDTPLDSPSQREIARRERMKREG
jgi:dihydrofolate reductase